MVRPLGPRPQNSGIRTIAPMNRFQGYSGPRPIRTSKNFTYTTNVRNPIPTHQQAPEETPAPETHAEQLTASMLAGAPPQEQKQMLGEKLYPYIRVGESELRFLRASG